MPTPTFLGGDPLLDRFRLVFQADELRPYPQIVIDGKRNSSLEVRIHFSDLLGDRVLLDIAHGIAPRVSDLIGSGSHRAGKGYGTLVVNVAIQALRRMTGPSNDTRITGLISDDRAEVADFWSKFGFAVTRPEPSKYGSMEAKLGDLTVQQREYRAGGIFDVAMDISWFRVEENRDFSSAPKVRM